MTANALEELDFDYAADIADRAAQAMKEHGILPIPNNFTVWFHYLLGTTPTLNRTIDILISNKRKFDASTNADLFSAISGYRAEQTVAAEVSQQLSTVMDDAKEFLSTAISDNRLQMKEIGNVADDAAGGASPKALIERLVSELSKAANRASKLETNFVQTSKELDTIRDSLSKSEERAKTDTLTGLPNRRALDEFFRAAQMAAMEKGEPLSVLLLDIDHFKKFNDNFGHGVGDQVLRLMAKVLTERVRSGDLPARYGGEELIVVLPGAELTVCTKVAESIRQTISERRLTRRSTGESLPSITVSIGVGQFRPGESMNELIERCDRALYRAKGTGRNRVLTENDVDASGAAPQMKAG